MAKQKSLSAANSNAPSERTSVLHVELVSQQVRYTHTNTHHLSLFLLTTIVPATISYTVLLCWKKSSVINAGKKNAMEKFLFRARMVDLREERYNNIRDYTSLQANCENIKNNL